MEFPANIKEYRMTEQYEESDREYQIMQWLADKLPGKLSCADEYMRQSELLAEALAEELHMLWRVDISDCPYSGNLDEKLRMAKYNVEHSLVDELF